jgi:hypothetical protein
MDVLLLGAAAVVLLLLTIWIVWRPSGGGDSSSGEEANRMMPQGDQFEDQYTSATADLSAGGVALSSASSEPSEQPASTGGPQLAPRPAGVGAGASPPSTTPAWPADTLRLEGSASGFEPIRRAPADDLAPTTSTPRKIGVGAAGLLTLGGAIGGAWLYARWQRERNKPLNRLRRRFG